MQPLLLDLAFADEKMTDQAEILLAAFRKALPEADLGICLTTPPNGRESAFTANYKGRYTRKGWRSIQYRLVVHQLKHFGGREKEHIYIVPTAFDLDVMTGIQRSMGCILMRVVMRVSARVFTLG
ncbi:MAG: hypothetical protein L3J39_01140 [Verrucomicrobiales bacterium]|nr:hypothetical protein [Verrucomicrobiales bacterium]